MICLCFYVQQQIKLVERLIIIVNLLELFYCNTKNILLSESFCF